jgi:hypothetical protein
MADRILTAQFPRSTSLKSAAYNADTNVLTLVFKQATTTGKTTYHYSAVPKRIWDALTSAASVGAYVQKNVVGKFDEVVEEDEATRGRAALKLLEELLDETGRRMPHKDLISTSPAFDRHWLPRARKATRR